MNLAQNKRLLFLGSLGILLAVIITLYITLSSSPNALPETTDLEKQAFLNLPVAKQTTQQDLENLPGFKEKTSVADRTQFTYTSPNLAEDNMVIVDTSNTVIYKRYVSVTATLQHPKISDYVKTYGTPEKEATGSNKYGPYAKTYIYSSKGIVFVGNPLTDEIEEIHMFIPMSTEEFVNKYGQDINENIKPHVEN